MAVGFGLYVLPIICALMVVIALAAIKPLEHKLFGKEAEALLEHEHEHEPERR
jgi:uncharacterized membrane protein YhiD involved in acid resistance